MTTDIITHAGFCLPRPGEAAPLIETYRREGYSEDGRHVIARLMVLRCQECGEQVGPRRPGDQRLRARYFLPA